MMNNAATTTSSFFQQFRIVFGFIYELRSLSRRRGIQVEEEVAAVEEDDLEAGPPEAVEEVNVLSILPKFPASFFAFTLIGLYALLQIKWQLPQLGFPSPTLRNWYIVCVSSLITELVASIAQWIISAAAAAAAAGP